MSFQRLSEYFSAVNHRINSSDKGACRGKNYRSHPFIITQKLDTGTPYYKKPYDICGYFTGYPSST